MWVGGNGGVKVMVMVQRYNIQGIRCPYDPRDNSAMIVK